MTDFVNYDNIVKDMFANCGRPLAELVVKWLLYDLRHQDGTKATDQEVEELYQTMLKLIKEDLDEMD